jgi:carbonic anhydrase
MSETKITADQALQALLAGNARFAQGSPLRPHQYPERRKEVSPEQHPFAAILTCSDSRVSPELIFDQGLGDLYVMRNAGNIVGNLVLGSLEHAVDHLDVPLILVIGHTLCGAIAATVKGGEVSAHLAGIVAALQPAVQNARKMSGDLPTNAVVENVRLMVEKIKNGGPLLEAHQYTARKLKIAGGLYHLDTGLVEIIS